MAERGQARFSEGRGWRYFCGVPCDRPRQLRESAVDATGQVSEFGRMDEN